MQYSSPKGFSGMAQAGILLAFLGLGFILTAIAQFIIMWKMFPAGTSLSDMQKGALKAMMDPANIGYARMLQFAGTLFVLFVPAVLYSLVTNGKSPLWLGFNRYINLKQIGLVFLIMIGANLLASPLADLSKSVISHFPSLDAMALKMENAYKDQVLALSHLESWQDFLISIFIMSFLPALFEEVFFRGAFQNLLSNWWKLPLIAILVSSLLFSLIHMSIYLFMSRVVLGFALGYIFYITKNIWSSIIAHFLNNAIAVIQLFWLNIHKQPIDVSELDPKVEWWGGIIALFAVIILFKLLQRYSIQNRLKIEAKMAVSSEQNNPFPFVNT